MMSMVFGSREVSAGPTIGFQGGGGRGGDGSMSPSSSSSTYGITTQHQQPFLLTSSSTSINGGHSSNKHDHRQLSRFSLDPSFSSSSSETSSMNGDSDDDQECTSQEVVEDDSNNKRKLGQQQTSNSSSLCSMQSIEDSLPIKRGLSNYFSGRSRSFANLSEATSVETLAKSENPFNKRRRTLMACKWSRQAFYTSRTNPVSMPLLKLDEDQELLISDDDHDEEQDQNVSISNHHHQNKNNNNNNKMIKRFKQPLRCFSLTDLHHQQQHHQHQQQNV